MKKFLTLVLALVMALAIALPAMAFTSDTSAPDESVPYELDVYLVEYDNDEFFGITSLPPSDRGYAKNEIVAAIAEIHVPDGAKAITTANYGQIVLSGTDVTFNVTEANQYSKNLVISGAGQNLTVGTQTNTKKTFSPFGAGLADDATYKILFFAKVTGDEAALTAKLIDGSALASDDLSDNNMVITLSGVNYTVTKSVNSTTGGYYLVQSADGSFRINVDKNNKSTGMSVATESSITSTSGTALGVTVGGTLGIVSGNTVVTSGSTFEAIMDVYDDVVKGVWGLDYMLVGNYVRDSFFEKFVSADTITATVEIKPWTAYVTVPDNIVVDPPKTGDAASIVGFVMIVLAAAAVVAVKKVRA